MANDHKEMYGNGRDLQPERFYLLDFTIDGIKNTYTPNVTCQGTVPQAIEEFLEADDFESTIRNAVSLGGDTDTLAAMAGSIAEASNNSFLLYSEEKNDQRKRF